jgi:hypothetical protein
MSYSPSTKLSHTNGSQCATVLTDSKIMVTCGLGVGQIMSLQDWLILSDDAIIHNASAIPEPAPTATLVPTAAPVPPAQIGSKFTWTLTPQTYRVAIMTSKGLFQVKSVTDDQPDYVNSANPVWRPLKKAMFTDETAWRTSLPDGGVVELIGPKRSEPPTPDLTNLSDVEKVKQYMKQYNVRSKVYEKNSPQSNVDWFLNSITSIRKELNDISLEDDLNSRKRHVTTLRLNQNIRLYNFWCDQAKATGVNANKGDLQMSPGGSSKLWVYTQDDIVPRDVCVYNNKIAVRIWNNIILTHVTLYDSFAEMGSNVKLDAVYRTKRIYLV